jgi:hypothetical protein
MTNKITSLSLIQEYGHKIWKIFDEYFYITDAFYLHTFNLS